MVDALTALAANFPASSEVNHSLRAKAIAIALRLEGTNPGAIATNNSLKAGDLPAPVSGFGTLAEVAERLWDTAAFLESPEMGDDERVLQFCLVDIAREIDSSNLSESNRYPTGLPAAIFAGWQAILGKSGEPAFVFPKAGEENGDTNPETSVTEPPPTTGIEPVIPSNLTRKAQGSYRSLSASGSSANLTQIGGDINAGSSPAPLAIIFSYEKGDTEQPLNRHRGALVSALTSLYGSWPQDGGVVILSVSEEDADDAALLLPGTILADSLIRERQLDPRTLALGFVAGDGSVLRVEKLHDRLAAFNPIDIDTILVPEDNLPELQDMALLGELAPFFRFQIILVSNLEEATRLAAAEHDAGFETTLRKFNNIRTVAKDTKLPDLVGLDVIQSKFREITNLNPKHASAAVLLELGEGELPGKLTRGGSLSALSRATDPVFRTIGVQVKPDRSAVIAALESVTKIQPILDQETAALGGMMSALLKDIGRYASIDPTAGPAAELRDKIASTLETVEEESDRLKNSDG